MSAYSRMLHRRDTEVLCVGRAWRGDSFDPVWVVRVANHEIGRGFFKQGAVRAAVAWEQAFQRRQRAGRRAR